MLQLITQNGLILETIDYNKARMRFDDLALNLSYEATPPLPSENDFVILIDSEKKLVKHARGCAKGIGQILQQLG